MDDCKLLSWSQRHCCLLIWRKGKCQIAAVPAVTLFFFLHFHAWSGWDEKTLSSFCKCLRKSGSNHSGKPFQRSTCLKGKVMLSATEQTECWWKPITSQSSWVSEEVSAKLASSWWSHPSSYPLEIWHKLCQSTFCQNLPPDFEFSLRSWHKQAQLERQRTSRWKNAKHWLGLWAAISQVWRQHSKLLSNF